MEQKFHKNKSFYIYSFWTFISHKIKTAIKKGICKHAINDKDFQRTRQIWNTCLICNVLKNYLMFHLIGFKYKQVQTSHSNFVKIIPIHKWTSSLKRKLRITWKHKPLRNLNTWQTTENLLVSQVPGPCALVFKLKISTQFQSGEPLFLHGFRILEPSVWKF